MMTVVCTVIFTRQKYSVKPQVVRFFLVLIGQRKGSCNHIPSFLRKIGVLCQNVAAPKLAVFCSKVVLSEKSNMFSVKICNINILIFNKIIFKKS